jgi:hypothetical protein
VCKRERESREGCDGHSTALEDLKQKKQQKTKSQFHDGRERAGRISQHQRG